MKKRDNFVLGLWIETARDFVAKEHCRLAGEFHRKSKAALLPAGKDTDKPSGKFRHIYLVQNANGGLIKSVAAHSSDAQLDGIGDALPDAKVFVRDTELRNVTDFGRREIMMYEVASLPVDHALFFPMGDSGDDLQKRALAAARWSKDRSEVAAGKYRGNIGEQRVDFAVLSNGEREISKFEHDGSVAKAVVSDNAKGVLRGSLTQANGPHRNAILLFNRIFVECVGQELPRVLHLPLSFHTKIGQNSDQRARHRQNDRIEIFRIRSRSENFGFGSLMTSPQCGQVLAFSIFHRHILCIAPSP